MPFPYKTVLITGATSGIGLALAERMISAGIFVITIGRRKDRLEALAEKYGSEKVAAEPFDVSDLDAMPAWDHIQVPPSRLHHSQRRLPAVPRLHVPVHHLLVVRLGRAHHQLSLPPPHGLPFSPAPDLARPIPDVHCSCLLRSRCPPPAPMRKLLRHQSRRAQSGLVTPVPAFRSGITSYPPHQGN
ncbi:uncharacterized protein PODANS_2_13450 [Podospora anserina S mat+]|uniref:Dehydrogenase n=1 Tax=Podospora anserina (strain S / ATCC MYA-4624 / DSM 980 / FGSC 10383) TaxID=515849 RepID=B2B863_PODAN|nr:uncharacterized protein PODANS_2_13450 [Podospora anserina S mat+]CAP73992.1 unnamed protein product [Podospora anserina S mat+]CDP26393.1 Putative dehydrogenase [Podospora anserina S mat+]